MTEQSTAVFLVGSHMMEGPSYRVTRYPNHTYRCTCRNFIFNRDKPNWPEDKHIADAKANADNVTKITNPDMAKILTSLEDLCRTIEATENLSGTPAIWFQTIRDELREHETKLTGADQAYLMTEIAGAEVFWTRYDQKRREEGGIKAADDPWSQPKKTEGKTGVYIL